MRLLSCEIWLLMFDMRFTCHVNYGKILKKLHCEYYIKNVFSCAEVLPLAVLDAKEQRHQLLLVTMQIPPRMNTPLQVGFSA